MVGWLLQSLLWQTSATVKACSRSTLQSTHAHVDHDEGRAVKGLIH